jgi:hypothetical protein
MALGGVALACAFFVKFAAALLIPIAGIATIASWRQWRGWLAFWGAFAVAMGAASGVFAVAAGEPLQWLRERAYPAFGHDVTHQLGRVLAIYPRYVLWTDPDHGVWMFGATGILGLAGMIVAAVAAARGSRLAGGGLVLLGLGYVLLFNFAPHKLDLTRFYSHPRIFRYLAQVSPFLYLGAAFATDQLWRRGGAARVAGGLLLAACCAFGLQQMPAVTAPSRDPGADGLALSRFFREQLPAGPVVVHGDQWNCNRLRYMNVPESRHWIFDCRDFLEPGSKRAFLETIDHGYVVTGGGALDWYSLHPWVLNLSEAGFTPGAGWTLLTEREAPVTAWRAEPLRIWKVRDALGDTALRIADPAFEACLRARVRPFRPQDGLDSDQPITIRLAGYATSIECPDAGIREVGAFEAFPRVTVLNLAGNRLTTIDVEALARLEVLILGINELERVSGLSGLERLRMLWLGHNRLEAIDLSGLRALEDLRLDRNRLTRLTGAADLVRLETLYLGGNPDLDCDALGLPPELVARSGCGD